MRPLKAASITRPSSHPSARFGFAFGQTQNASPTATCSNVMLFSIIVWLTRPGRPQPPPEILKDRHSMLLKIAFLRCINNVPINCRVRRRFFGFARPKGEMRRWPGNERAVSSARCLGLAEPSKRTSRGCKTGPDIEDPTAAGRPKAGRRTASFTNVML